MSSTLTKREKIRSTSKIYKLIASIKTIAYFEIMRQNKNIFGGLIYVFMKPFVVTMILYFFIAVIRKGYPITEGISEFLLPITFFYFINDFINSTNFFDSRNSYKYLPNVNDISILFGKVLQVLVIYYQVVLLVIVFIYFLGLNIKLSSLMYLFTISFFFGTFYFLAGTILFSGNSSLKEIHSYIPRFLIFVSCVIFPLRIFPIEVQQILLWNPLVHITELARLSLNQNILIDKPAFLSLVYPMICILIFALIFMVAYIIKIQILKYQKNIKDFV